MKKYSRFIDAHTLLFERQLPCSPSCVWDYLTKSECLSQWLADGEIGAPGTRYYLNQDTDRVPMRMPGGIAGTVKEVEAPHRLVITWAGTESPDKRAEEESIVSFDVADKHGEAVLILRHEQITTGFLAMVGAGWDAHVEILVACMKGQPRPQPMDLFKSLLPAYVKDAEAMGDTVGAAGKAILESLSNNSPPSGRG